MTDDGAASAIEQEPAAPEAPVVEVAPEPAPLKGRRRRRNEQLDGDGVRHTRIGAAWAAVAAITVLGVALVDFIVENTDSVPIHFFSAAGHLPVAAALLAAALAGAAVVLAVGVCRTAQLRLSIRKRRRASRVAPSTGDEHGQAASGKLSE